jgi:hypothetical protein
VSARLLVACAAAFACGCAPSKSGEVLLVSCGQASTCPNDPPATEFEIDQCKSQVAGSCGRAYQAYYDCYADDRVCAFDGTTDVLATEQACQGASAAVSSCVDGGAD